MEVAEIMAWAKAQGLDASPAVPEAPLGTCPQGASDRKIDFFLMARQLGEEVVHTHVVLDKTVKPHRPVMATLVSQIRPKKMIIQKPASELPPEPIFGAMGCKPLPQDWGKWREDLRQNWEEGDVDGIYGAWANLAEQELADTLGVKLDPKKAERGDTPKYVIATRRPPPSDKQPVQSARTQALGVAQFWLRQAVVQRKLLAKLGAGNAG